MMAHAITKEDVVQIVGEMTARGDNPTVKAVRVALGNRGSFATLVPMVREAKAALSAAPLPIDNPLVRAVEALKPGVWAELLRTAKDEVSEQMAAVEQMAIDRAAETDALEAERIEQDTVVEELRKDLAATQAERTTALDALHVVSQIAAAVAAVQASVNQVASRLAEVESGVERHVAEIGERLDSGLAHVREQLAAEQRDAVARSERDADAMQSAVMDQVSLITSFFSAQLASLTSVQRSSFFATKKSIAQLSAATRMTAQTMKDCR